MLQDLTDDPAKYRAALATIAGSGKVESTSEALGVALDELTWRPDATPCLIVYTDEDDDYPSPLAPPDGDFEPPLNWASTPRTAAFQAVLDQIAGRLIDAGAFVLLFTNPGDRPTEFQLGSAAPPGSPIAPGPGSPIVESIASLPIAGTQKRSGVVILPVRNVSRRTRLYCTAASAFTMPSP